MKQTRLFFTVLLVLVAGILSAQTVKVGDKAPDFSFKLATGETVTLADYKDKAVLLHFWATWCPPCIRELPEMNKLAENLGSDKDTKLDFIAVCVSDEEKSRAAFMKKNNYTFKGGLDTTGKIAYAYGIEGVPSSILIEDGIVKKVTVGAMSKPQISSFVSDYVKF